MYKRIIDEQELKYDIRDGEIKSKPPLNTVEEFVNFMTGTDIPPEDERQTSRNQRSYTLG